VTISIFSQSPLWELDALPPEKLINIFSENIDALTDFSELAKMKELERQDKDLF